MKTPLCEACLATNSFCAACQRKLESGEVTQTELKIAQTLRGENLPSQAGFERALELKDAVLVFTLSPAAVIGRKGQTVRALSKALGKKVKVIDDAAAPHEKISEVLLPARVLGINTVFKSSGKEFHVRVPRSEARLLPDSPAALNSLLSQFLGAPANIVFE
ncbi:MAG: KH domain-containing protein [Candidatus Norongarragalinales archaeon]